MGTQASTHAPAAPFQAAFRVAEGLGVQYHIQNTRSKPIYLFNVLWDYDPTGNYVKAPQPAYSCIKGGRGIHVAQQILPAPKTTQVEQRIIPFATKVEPGQTYTGSFTLPLPVREYSAYFPGTPESPEEELTAEAVIFTLQFVEEASGMTVKPSPLGEGLQVWHPQLLAMIQTVQSQPYHARIAAKKRKDKFEDF